MDVNSRRDIVTSILKSGRNEASPRFSIVHFPFPLTLAGSPYNKCTFTIRVYYQRIRWPIFRPLFCCFIRTRCPLHTGEGEGHGFCFDLSYISLPSKFHQVGAQFARLNSSSEISRRRAKTDVKRVVEIFSRMGIDMILASIDIRSYNFSTTFLFLQFAESINFFLFRGQGKVKYEFALGKFYR